MSDAQDRFHQAEQLLRELEGLESRLRELQQGVTRSHRLTMLGTLASMVAHEFNNILTPVISYCQLAQQSPDDVEMLGKAVDKSLQGASRASRICSSMLGFAHPSGSAEQAELRGIVDDVLGCLARDPEKDGIALHLSIPQELWVHMPPIQAQQVLLNLILNARRAMRKHPRQGGRLSVHAHTTADSQMVEITIADTGPGIPEDIQPRIFEPFVSRPGQGSSAHANDVEGTGLGLAICRELLREAGGDIRLHETSAQGTTFRVHIPAARRFAERGADAATSGCA